MGERLLVSGSRDLQARIFNAKTWRNKGAKSLAQIMRIGGTPAFFTKCCTLSPAVPPKSAGGNQPTADDRLQKLNDLLAKNLISQAEFDAKRQQIAKRMRINMLNKAKLIVDDNGNEGFAIVAIDLHLNGVGFNTVDRR